VIIEIPNHKSQIGLRVLRFKSAGYIMTIMEKGSNKKNKAEKANLPFKKMSEKEKDYVAVVLEEVRSNFKAFGESLDFIRMKGDATFGEVGKIREELEEVKDSQILMQADVSVLKQDVKQINVCLDNIEKEVFAIRGEINALKPVLIQKADIEFFKKLEARLTRVERHLNMCEA